MKIFLDTSSLIKLYHFEKGTAELDQIFEADQIEIVYLSEISRIEFESAIWKKIRTKEIPVEVGKELISYFRSDYSKFHFVVMQSDLIQLAQDSLTKYGSQGLRTLDSMQMASAI